jgi:hypothetical protein
MLLRLTRSGCGTRAELRPGLNRSGSPQVERVARSSMERTVASDSGVTNCTPIS